MVLPDPHIAAEPPPASVDDPYIVQPGDNLWDISETKLAVYLQRPPDDGEIAPYWHETIDANRDAIASSDPDLIYPGESLALPPPPGTPVAPQPLPPPNGNGTSDTGPPAAPPLDEAPPSTTSPTNPPTTSPTTTATTDTPATTTPGTTLPPTTAGDPTTTPSTDRSGSEEDNDSPLSQPGVLAAAGVTTALAALSLHALARRRRARRRTARPGTETPARSDDDLATELALANVSNGALDRAWHAAQQLRIAVPDTELPTVTGIVVTPTGDVTLHLRNPGPPAPPFTESPTASAAWYLPADTEPPQGPDPATPLLETVVAVGRTNDESWVFLDLESLGAITIDGDPTQAVRLARSIAA